MPDIKNVKITPMLKHFLKTKEEYPEHILFYRMGDFYEMFFEDAVIVSKELGITLTKRSKSSYPMAGVPHHAKLPYLRKLISKGYSVAICEQVEDPKTAKGVVKREVVEIITPGVQFDYESLNPDSNNYLLTIIHSGKNYQIAYFDMSTLDFYITKTDNEVELLYEVSKISPSEILLNEDFLPSSPIVESLNRSYNVKAKKFEENILTFYNIKYKKAYKNLINTSFSYLDMLKKLNPTKLPKIVEYSINSYMKLPESTINNLELFKSMSDKTTKGSLFWVMNKTITPMGARKLKYVISHPLKDITRIKNRVDGVDFLIKNQSLSVDLKENLKEIFDIERLLGRTLSNTLQPKDMLAISRTIDKLEEMIGIIAALRLREPQASDRGALIPTPPATGQAPLHGGDLSNLLPIIFDKLINSYKDLSELIKRINKTIIETPPATMKDGGYIKKGVDKKLDEIIEISEHGADLLVKLEIDEKRKTRIPTIKVKYNRVFGYFIEVSKSYIKEVPEHYQAKQTLSNATRYITQELKELEIKLLNAKEQRLGLESKLYQELHLEISKNYLEIKENSELIANIDLLYGLSVLAIENDYTKPQFLENEEHNSILDIKEGRHPVLEKNLELESFIPNDLSFDTDNRFIILTGPNMAGKSTVMRQAALIVLMAQIGSFVPASFYQATIFDAIFTRVGASDNLTKGESTFMVEMKETAEILQNASASSLIIVDELGRGTSTFDGMSLAWAIAEFIHDKVKALTIFATHYHEMTNLKNKKEHVLNYSIGIKEIDGNLYFLRKLIRGAANKSYGIHVAKLAGIPDNVVRKADKILKKLEQKEIKIDAAKKKKLPLFDDEILSPQEIQQEAKGRVPTPPATRQAPLQGGELSLKDSRVYKKLKKININNMTPIEALNYLNELVKEIK